MWFWAGDGDADGGLLPHFPQYESDGYGVGIAYKHVAGSYQLLIDNLLDLSHAPFVHKGLLGDRNTVANWDFSYDQGPRHIVDRRFFAARPAVPAWRSEEHTSELQSLMRISYAVFCLKNKIHDTTYTNQHSSSD